MLEWCLKVLTLRFLNRLGSAPPTTSPGSEQPADRAGEAGSKAPQLMTGRANSLAHVGLLTALDTHTHTHTHIQYTVYTHEHGLLTACLRPGH